MIGDQTRALVRSHIWEFGACFEVGAAAMLVQLGWTIVLDGSAPEGCARVRPPRKVARA